MYKIGLSTCGKDICEELFKSYKDAGIEAMEISMPAEKYKDIDYAKISELSKKYGVELWTFHLPFMPFEELDISRREICEQTIEYWSELIKKASEIGIDKFVIHASGEPIDESDRADRLACAKESLKKLADIAETYGGVIAVEDLPRSCIGRDSSDVKELVSADDRLMVCFDSNHLLGEDNVDFIRELGDKIITTHISDYDFINERHWLPGEGKVDWQSILKALGEVNYKGVWLYEIDFECPETILRDRDLTCEDFVKNAKEVFENKKITVCSKPKPNLGMWE